jgi:epoxyqueuosine reductase
MRYFNRDFETRVMRLPLLAGQKSAFLFSFPYPAILDSPHFSCYALFEDYHLVIGRKLAELERFLKERLPGIKARAFVDTLPVMEKPLAAIAGLGFQGKNTLLITPSGGTYCFIGGILTDHAFKLDAREPVDGCGRCKKCIDACPTQALSDKGLDARRCLSYHNVENRGEVPVSIQDKMGERVFGCGICEKVCPRNGRIQEGRYDDWEGDRDLAAMDLAGIYEKTMSGFAKTFSGTPMLRLGKKRFLRNIAIAMGNSDKKEYIFHVKVMLEDDYCAPYAKHALEKLEQLK